MWKIFHRLQFFATLYVEYHHKNGKYWIPPDVRRSDIWQRQQNQAQIFTYAIVIAFNGI